MRHAMSVGNDAIVIRVGKGRPGCHGAAPTPEPRARAAAGRSGAGHPRLADPRDRARDRGGRRRDGAARRGRRSAPHPPSRGRSRGWENAKSRARGLAGGAVMTVWESHRGAAPLVCEGHPGPPQPPPPARLRNARRSFSALACEPQTPQERLAGSQSSSRSCHKTGWTRSTTTRATRSRRSTSSSKTRTTP